MNTKDEPKKARYIYHRKYGVLYICTYIVHAPLPAKCWGWGMTYSPRADNQISRL